MTDDFRARSNQFMRGARWDLGLKATLTLQTALPLDEDSESILGDEVDELSQDQLNLLETIYDVLRTQDRWPPYRFLEDYLDAKYRIDIEKLAGTLPRNLTTLPLPWHPKNDQQEIQLTIEGLRYVELPGADDDVGLFFRIFRRFVEHLNR